MMGIKGTAAVRIQTQMRFKRARMLADF